MIKPPACDKNNIYKHPWIENIDNIFCASYAIKNDEDLTLISANQAFYDLIGCKEQDIRFKYGSRMAAILDAEVLKPFGMLADGEEYGSIRIKQPIKRAGGTAWLDTSIVAFGTSGGTILCCTAVDITTYEDNQKKIESCSENIKIATAQTGIDYFAYDFDSKTAYIYSECSVLPSSLVAADGSSKDFLQRLVSEQIVLPEYTATLYDAFQAVYGEAGKAVCELKINKREQEPIWVRFTLIIKENRTQAVGIFEDIGREKYAATQYLNETQFYQAMLSEKTAFAQVNVTNDRIIRIGGMWNLYNEIIDKVSYSQLIAEFINKVVHPDDRKHYLEVMQCRNFIDSLNNGIDRVGCEFRRIVDQNKMCWMELSVHLFRNPLTQNAHALLCIKNIDEKKNQMLSLQQTAQAVEAKQNIPRTTAVRQQSDLADFDALVGEHGDIAYIIDVDTFELLCGNKAFFDRIGMTQAQCQYKKCYELMHKRDTPCPFCSKANWFTDKFYIWRNLNQALEQEFLIKNRLINWKGQEVMLAIAVDISNNKSIVDSMDNEATEIHSILSGVQRMTESTTLAQSMQSAMEAIGIFFRADAVRLWQHTPTHKAYNETYVWTRKPTASMSERDSSEINRWISGRNLDHQLILESPEAMLGYSYTMYQYMKRNNIKNQRWFLVKENDEQLGCISIDNISSNFQNTAFIESFSVFIAGEMKKRELMEKALYAARHDSLTDLLSRKSFEDYMATYEPDKVQCISTTIANFDNIKVINSNRGFQVGNYFIQQFAAILREIFVADAIFRLNGDEFLVVSPNIARKDLENKINQVEQSIANNGAFTVSIGCAWDDIEKDIAVLIEQATQKMKIHKKRYYDESPVIAGRERRKMINELTTAIDNRQYEVFLQPKVELEHGTLVGAEALIRYLDKEKGYVPPAMFIDMLEKNNLIRYIDLFVFEEVCRQLEKWKKDGVFMPVISLNFSRLTLLEKDILAAMHSIIAKYDVDKKYIEIEITESIASVGKSVLQKVTRDIQQAGFAISLDDFGTKYTNLAMLGEMDLDVLKIDRSLVNELGGKQSNELIMKNIIHMCRDIGVSVIAEGIETEAQESILRQLGCAMGQGYLYDKPMPIAIFETKYLYTNKPSSLSTLL